MLNNKQLNLLIVIGIIIVLPLIGTTIFNSTKYIIEYYNYGYYHYECLAYLSGAFDASFFDICKSTNVNQLIIYLVILIPIFIYTANRIRTFILYPNKRSVINESTN